MNFTLFFANSLPSKQTVGTLPGLVGGAGVPCEAAAGLTEKVEVRSGLLGCGACSLALGDPS